MFTEEQTAPRGLRITAWVVLSFCAFFTVLILFLQYMSETENPNPVPVIAFTFVLPLILFVWMMNVKQIVTVTAELVQVKQRGIMPKAKVYRLTDIENVKVRKLDAFGEFGGWGVRYGFGKKWGYVLDGKSAIELQLKNGKKAVISVVDGEGAQQAIERLIPRLQP